MQKLQEEFRNFYSEELLKELHSQLEIRANWLARLVNSTQAAQHPIRHLLLMRFLGCTAAEFFQMPVRHQPFGAGPWPCLNPVCGHYQEASIEKFEIRRRKVGPHVKKAADFRCVCGFTYSRLLPDATAGSDADGEFASAVRAAAERLKQAPGLPFRISKHAIAQEIGVVAVIYQRPHLLPETISVLEEVSEGMNDLAVRRIKWAAESLREENQPPTSYWQILARASVNWRVIRRSPVVRAVLQAVAREFGISAEKLNELCLR